MFQTSQSQYANWSRSGWTLSLVLSSRYVNDIPTACSHVVFTLHSDKDCVCPVWRYDVRKVRVPQSKCLRIATNASLCFFFFFFFFFCGSSSSPLFVPVLCYLSPIINAHLSYVIFHIIFPPSLILQCLSSTMNPKIFLNISLLKAIGVFFLTRMPHASSPLVTNGRTTVLYNHWTLVTRRFTRI